MVLPVRVIAMLLGTAFLPSRGDAGHPASSTADARR
jgi:hypothetical protein